MNKLARIGAGLLVSLFALAGLSACAGSSTHQEEGTNSVTEEIAEAGQATVEETEEVVADASEATSKTSQEAEKSIESSIGGGPVESDTIEMIESVEKGTQKYQDRVAQAGEKIDVATRLRFEQIQESAQQLREQFNEMKQEANLDVAALDVKYESTAEEIMDAWENVEPELRDALEKVEQPTK